jgi:hypothetical protein
VQQQQPKKILLFIGEERPYRSEWIVGSLVLFAIKFGEKGLGFSLIRGESSYQVLAKCLGVFGSQEFVKFTYSYSQTSGVC